MNHEDEDNGVELGSFPWIDYRLGDPNETVATGFWNDGGMNVGGSSETDILSGSKSGVIIITH